MSSTLTKVSAERRAALPFKIFPTFREIIPLEKRSLLRHDTGGNSICKIDWYSKTQGQEIDRGWSIPDGQRSQRKGEEEVWIALVSSGCRVTNRIEGKGTRARAMNRGIDLSRLGRAFFSGDRARRRGGRSPPDRSRFRHGPAQNDRLFPLARFLLSFRHRDSRSSNLLRQIHRESERFIDYLFLFLRSCNFFPFFFQFWRIIHREWIRKYLDIWILCDFNSYNGRESIVPRGFLEN